jgi:glutamine synthetase
LEKATKGDSGKLNDAVQSLLKKMMNDHWAIVYNGDNYTAEWHAEAEKRGLPNLRTTIDALPAIIDPEVVKMFDKYGVLSPRETESRYEIYLEQYVKTVTMEAKLTLKIGQTICWPAAIRYQSELATTCANLKAVGYKFDTNTLDKITELVKNMQDSLTALAGLIDHKSANKKEHAKVCCEKLVPAMLEVRKYADQLESMVADDLWPLPTYQEMLFIK